eukprot:8998784-Alexandrium_andersonii.AAC.1
MELIDMPPAFSAATPWLHRAVLIDRHVSTAVQRPPSPKGSGSPRRARGGQGGAALPAGSA